MERKTVANTGQFDPLSFSSVTPTFIANHRFDEFSARFKELAEIYPTGHAVPCKIN